MKLIDTNIFIYASGKSHPCRQKCLQVLEQVISKPTAFNISSEILQEILHVYTNKKDLEKGITLVEMALKMFPQIFPITTAEIITTCTVLKKYPGLNARDALHAAVVINYGLEGIVSFDGHFDIVKEIKRFQP
ncbi:MAG: type II toxin-antitoxin system VapC family toxin [Dethiobacter sp.]|jgi:predicted nucleic acid-binding protein|nr:type II toxin-antitoxin system VapC family toxin [Dethiobacter sp.]